MRPQLETPAHEVMEEPEPSSPAEALPPLLELALSSPPTRVEGILVGRIVGTSDGFRVTFPGCRHPEGVPARSMVQLDQRDQGAEVALMFELGDPEHPCILGRIAAPSPIMTREPPRSPADVEVARDGERLVLRAEQEIVLACGDASITLTRAGKVIIRGAYVLSASTGVQRILGGSVEIN
jgi:hypothetical protein